MKKPRKLQFLPPFLGDGTTVASLPIMLCSLSAALMVTKFRKKLRLRTPGVEHTEEQQEKLPKEIHEALPSFIRGD